MTRALARFAGPLTLAAAVGFALSRLGSDGRAYDSLVAALCVAAGFCANWSP